jgi:hypothetical protein
VSAAKPKPAAPKQKGSNFNSNHTTPVPFTVVKLKKNTPAAVGLIKPPTEEPCANDSSFTLTTQAAKLNSNPPPRPSARKPAAKQQTTQALPTVTPKPIEPLPLLSKPAKSASKGATASVNPGHATPGGKSGPPKSKKSKTKQPIVEIDAPRFQPGGMVESDEDDGLEREIMIKTEPGSARTKVSNLATCAMIKLTSLLFSL